MLNRDTNPLFQKQSQTELKMRVEGGMTMTYHVIEVIILIVGVVFAFLRSMNKSLLTRYRVWGITTMLIVAPVLSWLAGSLYGINEGSGFAMIGVLIIVFPILFIGGFVLYWIGGYED